MRKFKILCVLLLICIFAGIVQDLLGDFSSGYTLASELREHALDKEVEYQTYVALDVTIKDSDLLHYNEVNTLSQDSVIMIPYKSTLVTPLRWSENEQIFISVAASIFTVIITVLLMIVLVYFVKIIWVFTRKEIFDKRITKWLSFMGCSFVALSVFSSAMHLLETYSAMQHIELSNYNINYGSIFDFSNLALGLIILVVNEILKSAIGMKKEQDLTI